MQDAGAAVAWHSGGGAGRYPCWGTAQVVLWSSTTGAGEVTGGVGIRRVRERMGMAVVVEAMT